jgi:hypothetical protein
MEKVFSKLHLGAFFASQKTGLSGGSVPPLHGMTAPRPSNPLRTNRPVNPQCDYAASSPKR